MEGEVVFYSNLSSLLADIGGDWHSASASQMQLHQEGGQSCPAEPLCTMNWDQQHVWGRDNSASSPLPLIHLNYWNSGGNNCIIRAPVPLRLKTTAQSYLLQQAHIFTTWPHLFIKTQTHAAKKQWISKQNKNQPCPPKPHTYLQSNNQPYEVSLHTEKKIQSENIFMNLSCILLDFWPTIHILFSFCFHSWTQDCTGTRWLWNVLGFKSTMHIRIQFCATSG